MTVPRLSVISAGLFTNSSQRMSGAVRARGEGEHDQGRDRGPHDPQGTVTGVVPGGEHDHHLDAQIRGQKRE